MNKKLIISAAIILFTLAGIAIFTELFKNDQPPGLVFPTAGTFSEEQSSAVTADAPSEETETSAETSEQQASENILYTSYDPLHSFCVSFDGSMIEISGVYEGDRVTSVSISGKGSVKAQYFGDRVYAELAAYGSDETDKLLIHFDSGWSLPVFIAYDDEGLPFALTTDAQQRSALALEHPITIPQSAVMEYVLTDGSSEEREAVLQQVQDISEQVCMGINDDYDKARALALWVAKNIYYDYVAFETEVTVETLSLARTLELQRTVCGGYANLYAALCQAQGITCHVVKGTVIQGGGTFAEGGHEAPSHEWNVVELDGRHIWVDNLWNTANGYDGEYYLGDQTYRYFDISDECMGINHRAERVEIRRFYE